MIGKNNGTTMSVGRQCELLGLARSSYYYQPCGESEENERLMKRMDEIYTEHPFYGSPRLTVCLRKEGRLVNEKRIVRLMKKMGLQAIFPKKNLSRANPQHRIYPYLLRGADIERTDQVWSTDITYIRLRKGFLYLTAVMDWFSRCVLSWELSNSLEGNFCVTALEAALSQGRPEIFNTDQGSQFTSDAFTGKLAEAGVRISMDGRGRCHDNIFIERLWRSVKVEEVYLRDYDSVLEACQGIDRYFQFYNRQRPHQSLAYRTPWETYQGGGGYAASGGSRQAS